MNKAFKTRQVLGHVCTSVHSISKMKKHALMSSHIFADSILKCEDCQDKKAHCYCLAA